MRMMYEGSAKRQKEAEGHAENYRKRFEAEEALAKERTRSATLERALRELEAENRALLEKMKGRRR